MKSRMMIVAMLVAMLLGGVILPTGVAQAKKPAPAGITTPITGTAADGSTFAGTFTVTQFANQAGKLVAKGTLVGTLTPAASGAAASQAISQAITLPVGLITGTCSILHLVLGPLDLNLLGLVVHLNQVDLNITAQQGGGLLGDLLCSVANLLNNNSPLNPLVSLLNNILKILG